MLHLTRPIMIATALLLSALTFYGCGDDKPKEDDKTKPHIEKHATASEEEEGAEAEEGEASPAKPKPVAPAVLPSKDVTVTASDNVVLVGTLWDPELKPPAPPPSPDAEEEEEEEDGAPVKPKPIAPVKKYPLVILIHQLNGSARDWKPLPEELVKRGYAVFAMDLRGHGRSMKRASGAAYKPWRDFDGADWRQLPSDIRRVIESLKGNKDIPEVDTTRVVLIGASIGANAALIRGAESSDTIKAVAMLSPGLDYKGLTTSIPMARFSNPVFFATSQADSSSFEATELLHRWATGPKSLRVYKDVGHGTDMLSVEPSLKKDLIAWLVKHTAP